MKTFYLPDLGEGLPDGEINQWHVKEGDEIKVDAPLVAIETAKAVVEVPSPFTGKIGKLYGKVGDVILTGSPLVDFEIEGKTGSSTVAGEIKESNQILVEKPISTSGSGAKALPAVRALAKKMKVDLEHITPTGPNGTITFEDVKKATQAGGHAATAGRESQPSSTEVPEGYEPLRGVRRTMASVMTQSHNNVVPVTLVDDANITDWEGQDYSVRILLALIEACKQEPALNAWFDTQRSARKLFKEIHIGLAMDTEEGLFVPVIKNAQDKSPQELRQSIDDLKLAVKNRTIAPEDLKGATIILSNFGKFAGRYVTVVVVPPTVAILGVGTIREEPCIQNGQVAVGKLLPLSLTTDHRVVTGGETTRFLGHVINALQQPR